MAIIVNRTRAEKDEIRRALGLPPLPLSVSDVGSCTCIGGEPYGFTRAGDTFTWRIDPACRYHQAAAEQPWNHRIPWNCPTYWDGCNCEGGPFYAESCLEVEGVPYIEDPSESW